MRFLCTLVVLVTAVSAAAVQPRFYLSTERVFAPGDQEVQVRLEARGVPHVDFRLYRVPYPEEFFLGQDDLHRVELKLKAPKKAKSFSFDFNFFSAEYPGYIKANYNDTFYAVIKSRSTNGGETTNISFDANNNSIEVDNNYFQQPFHPIPNWGTGFDHHGSTGWLRTSWPIKGGEEFTLTFTIHDEGDAVFDSLVLLDNFQWHDYDAVGTTDPLN